MASIIIYIYFRKLKLSRCSFYVTFCINYDSFKHNKYRTTVVKIYSHSFLERFFLLLWKSKQPSITAMLVLFAFLFTSTVTIIQFQWFNVQSSALMYDKMCDSTPTIMDVICWHIFGWWGRAARKTPTKICDLFAFACSNLVIFSLLQKFWRSFRFLIKFGDLFAFWPWKIKDFLRLLFLKTPSFWGS